MIQIIQCLVILTFAFLAKVAHAQVCPANAKPVAFKSDGCTSLNQYDRYSGASYLRCCFVHDLAYYRGGSEKRRPSHEVLPEGHEGKIDRDEADLALGKCVEDEINAALEAQNKRGTGNRILSSIGLDHAKRTAAGIVKAVKVFGDTSGECNHRDGWQWGYGWVQQKGCACRHKPNNAEVDKALRGLPGENATLKEIASWIKKNPTRLTLSKRSLPDEIARIERGEAFDSKATAATEPRERRPNPVQSERN